MFCDGVISSSDVLPGPVTAAVSGMSVVGAEVDAVRLTSVLSDEKSLLGRCLLVADPRVRHLLTTEDRVVRVDVGRAGNRVGQVERAAGIVRGCCRGRRGRGGGRRDGGPGPTVRVMSCRESTCTATRVVRACPSVTTIVQLGP